MKVVVKNIAQKVYEIELDPSSTVLAVKNMLNEQHALGSPETLKLIFQGKVLLDDETLNGSVNYAESKFMVVMVAKAKAPSAAAASPSVSAPASDSVKAASSLPSDSAAAPAPAAAPAAAAAAPAPAPVAASFSSAVQAQIDQICEMGFERAQVELCMRAAFNNGDRAVEYLMGGIPPSVVASMSQALPQRAVPAVGQPPRAPVAPQSSQASAPSQSVSNPFGDGEDDQDYGGYDEMGAQPSMGSLRRALAQNPQMISEILQEMGQSNPELVQQLVANPQALQQIFRSAAGEGGEDEGEEEDDFGGMEEQMGQQVVQLTPAEDATVRRITELGFPYERALEAFLFCDRNEELAVNYLLEHGEHFDQ